MFPWPVSRDNGWYEAFGLPLQAPSGVPLAFIIPRGQAAFVLVAAGSRAMEKLEKIGLIVGLITGIPTILGMVVWVTGSFRSLATDIQFLIIVVFLLVIFLIGFYTLLIVYRIAFPYKPPLVKSHTDPTTYIFLHGQWRGIPDPQTRDYLAHLLGFRPGEEDITLKSKDEVDKLRKGPALESVVTYAKR